MEIPAGPYRVRGLVSAGSPESIYSENPHGWIGATVTLNFPLADGTTIEIAFLDAFRRQRPAIPASGVRDVQIIGPV